MFTWILLIFQILLLLVAYFMVFRVLYILSTFKKQVPYVPAPRRAIKKMVEASGIVEQAKGKSRTLVKVIDLGSGTGKMILHIARLTPENVQLYGIEQSRLLHFCSKLRRHFSPRKSRITLRLGNWSTVHLKEFNYVFLFLTTPGFNSLLAKFKSELLAGSKVISYLFSLPDTEEVKKFLNEQKIAWRGKNRVFVYTKKDSPNNTPVKTG